MAMMDGAGSTGRTGATAKAEPTDRTDEFLQEYRRLEDAVRQRWPREVARGDSPLYVLKAQREFRGDATALDYFRELRNLLSHQALSHGETGVQVTEAAVAMVRDIVERVAHPTLVSQAMVPVAKVRTCGMGDGALEVIRDMQANSYTHVPVLEDGVVRGAFSENTVMCYLARDGIVGIDTTTTLADFREFLPLDAHVAESFRFVSRDMTAFALAEVFRKATRAGDRIGMAFVTQHGRPEERLLGIATVWDLAGE